MRKSEQAGDVFRETMITGGETRETWGSIKSFLIGSMSGAALIE